MLKKIRPTNGVCQPFLARKLSRGCVEGPGEPGEMCEKGMKEGERSAQQGWLVMKEVCDEKAIVSQRYQ